MNIKPSVAIRQYYNDIAELCKATGEPVYLTKNGEGDLVIMDIEPFTRREKMLKLREELLAVEEDRLHGAPDYSVDEVSAMMESVIREVHHLQWCGCPFFQRSYGYYPKRFLVFSVRASFRCKREIRKQGKQANNADNFMV